MYHVRSTINQALKSLNDKLYLFKTLINYNAHSTVNQNKILRWLEDLPVIIIRLH